MSRLPIEMIRLLEELPRREKKRENLFGIINWRLNRGRSFTLDEIISASKYKVSKVYARRVIDSVVALRLAVELPCGAYGPAPANSDACSAMVRNLVREKREASRKQIRLSMPTPIDDNSLDRILRDLVGKGDLVKVRKGYYGTPSCNLL